MADVINNPNAPQRSSSVVGWIALAIIAVLIVLGVVYLLPQWQASQYPGAPNTGSVNGSVNTSIPTNGGGVNSDGSLSPTGGASQSASGDY